MPASILHAGRFRLLSIAGAICLLIFTGSRSPAALQHGAPAHSAFEKAQRMREALEGRPDMAEAGGKDASKLDAALKSAADVVGALAG